MSSMMKPTYPKRTMILYKDNKENKEYKGVVTRASRVGGTDFFAYTVDLFAEKVETG